MIPTSPLPIHTPLMPSQSIEVSLPINTIGPVMKMDPLNNLQVQKPYVESISWHQMHKYFILCSINWKQFVQSGLEEFMWNKTCIFTFTQVAVKNSIDVFYFSVLIPLNIFFVEDGKMGMIVTHNFIHVWHRSSHRHYLIFHNHCSSNRI